MVEAVENTTNIASQVETEVIVGHACFCNRRFSRQDMIDIIYHLRDSERMRTYRERFFDLGNEFIEAIRITAGNINDENNESKLNDFTNQMNTMFETFEINTCKRKIHFLAQMYLETMQFRSTFENRTTVPANYRGGVDFQGRGMKQITHDYNYLAYQDYCNNTNNYDFYLVNRTGYESVGSFISHQNSTNNNGMDANFYEDLKTFARNLSQDLFHAFNSAGWFSTIHNSNTLALMDAGLTDEDVRLVTRSINGGENNLAERQNYTSWLREHFEYDTNCINR